MPVEAENMSDFTGLTEPFVVSFHYYIIQSYIAIIVLYVTIFEHLASHQDNDQKHEPQVVGVWLLTQHCCPSKLVPVETHVPYVISSHEIKNESVPIP